MSKRQNVFLDYMGHPIGNGQDPDAPGDPTANRSGDGMKIAGRGSQSGGSKPTPQAKRMTTGSGSRSSRVTVSGSYPRHSQRIRG